MSDEQLRRLLRSLEAPAEPDPGFAEFLFDELRAEARRSAHRQRRNPLLVLLAAALLLAALAGSTLALGSGLLEVPWLSRDSEPVLLPTVEPLTDEDLEAVVHCGEVQRSTTGGLSAVFDYVSDRPVPTAQVRVGEIEIDSELLSLTAVGLLELAYQAVNEPAFDGQQQICLDLEMQGDRVVHAALRDESHARVCGYMGIGSETVGLSAQRQPNPGTFALVHEAILGFAFHGYPTEALPNLGQLFHLSQTAPLCLAVQAAGGPDETSVNLTAHVDGCFSIDGSTDSVVAVRWYSGDYSEAQTLHLAGDSQIDQSLATGQRVGMRISAGRGGGGALQIESVAVTGCDAPRTITTPDAALAPDATAQVITNDLVLRSGPGVHESSVIHPVLLSEPTLLFIVDGPIAADGYEWYQVTPFETWISDVASELPSIGWVAAASREGEPWIRPAPLDCPEPTPSALMSLSGEAALACFGDQVLTLEGTITDCFDMAARVSPSWLTARGCVLQPLGHDPSEGGGITPVGLLLRYEDEAGPVSLGTPMRVVGSFDHVAARTCTDQPDVDEEPTAPELVVLGCRSTFVATEVSPAEGP